MGGVQDAHYPKGQHRKNVTKRIVPMIVCSTVGLGSLNIEKGAVATNGTKHILDYVH